MASLRKKTVLIIIYSEIAVHPRVLMELDALQADYDLICAGFGPVSGYPDVTFVDIEKLLEPDTDSIDFHVNYPSFFRKVISLLIKLLYRKRIRNLERTAFPWLIPYKVVNRLKSFGIDLVIAHGVEILPLAYELAGNIKPVILNAHEFYPAVAREDEIWVKETLPKIEYLCKKYLGQVSAMFSVSKGIAEAYEKQYGVKSEVVTNSKSYHDLKPQPVKGEKIRIIHHGQSAPNRHIEEMIRVMDFLPEYYTLDLMLFPRFPDYFAKLKEQYAHNPRVRFLPTVPTQEIPVFTNQYDIALYLLPPVNFNNRKALPNKFFEFIQARLAIAIGPSDEMGEYVKKYGLGVVSEDFRAESIALKIRALTPEQIMGFKNRCQDVAAELSSETDRQKILSGVRKLLAV